MARKLRVQYSGAVYHVYNRGIDRRHWFQDDDDHLRFIEQLEDTVDIYRVVVHAYCLMPNHFHLLIKTQPANLSLFMQPLQTA